MKFDPKKVFYKPYVYKSSGLNLAEFNRVITEVWVNGIKLNESYDNEIQHTLRESKSKRSVHVTYVWSKDRDGEDILKVKQVKKQ